MRYANNWSAITIRTLVLAVLVLASCEKSNTPQPSDEEVAYFPLASEGSTTTAFGDDSSVAAPALSGDLIYSRTREIEGTDLFIDESNVDACLASAAVVPSAIPADVLSDYLGRDVHLDVRISVDEVSGRVIEHQRLIASEPVSAPTLIAYPTDDVRYAELRVEAADSELLYTSTPVMDGDRYLVYVTFFPDIPADAPARAEWFSGLIGMSRRELIEAGEQQRQIEISNALALSRARLNSLGLCRFSSGTPAAHAAYLYCSEDEIRMLAEAASFVREIDIIDQGHPSSMRGDDLRADVGAQMRLHLENYFNGDHGTTPSRLNVNVALLDGQGFYRAWEHPAFLDWAGGPTRIKSHMYCDDSPYGCWNDTTSGWSGCHGATSMIGAYSHLLQGQDPAVSTTAAREDRTFGSYEADIEVYRWLAGGGEVALTYAADPPGSDDGVDVVVISWAGGSCDNVDSSTAWRDAWDFAYSHGALGVISAHNYVNRYNDNCTANGWATRPDLVVVGANGDDVAAPVNGKPATPIGSWDYDSQPVMGWHWTSMSGADNCPSSPPGQTTCWSSAYGRANLRTSSGWVFPSRQVIDLMSPSGRELGAQIDGAGNPIYSTQCCGTSQAAPNLGTVAVSLKDWANANGWSFFDGGFMHVNLLLMGDGTTGGHDGPWGPRVSGLDPLWGAGRLKERLFTNSGMDYPWGWGTGAFYINDGNVIDVPIGSGPISTDVDSWTGALAWDEPYLNASDPYHAAAYITMRVITTNPVGGACVNPGGGGGVTYVWSDTSRDVHKLIRLRPGRVENLWNKCAWIRFEGVDVPVDPYGYQRRWVYRADYWEDLDREGTALDDIE